MVDDRKLAGAGFRSCKTTRTRSLDTYLIVNDPFIVLA